jgi:hypothetical protein
MRTQQQDAIRRDGEPEPVPALPATEHRGGTRPDWDRARPGETLPELPDPELHDPPEG